MCVPSPFLVDFSRSFVVMIYQLAQRSVLLSYITSCMGSFPCVTFPISNPAVLVALYAVCVCRARTASWFVRVGACPEDVQKLCGWIEPSPGHAKRICKILKSEWWRQARLYEDCLKATCGVVAGRAVSARYREWCATRFRITEFLWNTLRPMLPKKKKKEAREPSAKVISLDGIVLPEAHLKTLGLGPKFCFEPTLGYPEILAVARSVAERVPEGERGRCVAEGAGVVTTLSGSTGRKCKLNSLVDYMGSSSIRPLVADKEGSFVLMYERTFSEKGMQAVHKNLKQVEEKPREVKKKAVALLEQLKLEGLAAAVRGAKGNLLNLFFTVKTHKEGHPFRVVVSERGTWQCLVSAFLQKHLSSLKVQDPFRVKNSEEVVQFLRTVPPGPMSVFSIDVEDLFYSLEHETLMKSVRDCIQDHNDALQFQNECGISVASFLELLSMYLRSTLVEWKGGVYRQKSGVCIGSRVAPKLSEVYLGRIDRDLEGGLESLALKTMRYVDDYLVFVEMDNCVRSRVNVLKMFNEKGRGLKFTFEVPKDGCIQFLDLKIRIGQEHTCWRYSPRSIKPILDFHSCNSKLVKNGVATSCLESALCKSCPHQMSEAFHDQLTRLRLSNFPEGKLGLLSERLLKKLKRDGNDRAGIDKRLPYTCIPYLHAFSHRMKKVGHRFGVNVVFSSRNKLGRVCAMVDRKAEGKEKKWYVCEVKHRETFVECGIGAVYLIPLSCGRCYIGQTGRCLNNRLMDHRASLKAHPSSNLCLHCRDCKCSPLFHETRVLSRHRDRTAREVAEAFYIHKYGDTCVARPSVTLHQLEIDYLTANF